MSEPKDLHIVEIGTVLAKGRPLPSGAKAGIVCRVRRWLGKRVCHFVHHKRGEKYRKTDCATQCDEVDTSKSLDSISSTPVSILPENETALWKEVVELEAKLTSMQDDHEVHEAEWRQLTINLERQRAKLSKSQRDRCHAAELETQLEEIMLQKIDIEDKSCSLKRRFKMKMARQYRPKMVNISVQTDAPSTEELYSSFLSYKSQMAELNKDILAQAAELDTLDQQMENDFKSQDNLIRETTHDIQKLEEGINRLTRYKSMGQQIFQKSRG